MSTVYKTIDEAAIAGTRAAIELARRNGWEYGGYVYAVDGGFAVTDIVTNEDSSGVSLEDVTPPEIEVLPHGKDATEAQSKSFLKALRRFVKGVFHVHVANAPGFDKELTAFFSPNDLWNMIGLETFAYLGVTDTGKVYKVDARTPKAFMASTGGLRALPAGAMIMAMVQDLPPFAVQGTEIYAGDGAEEARRAA